MRIVAFTSEIIRDDKLPYMLDNKIEPTIFNAGNVVIYVSGVPIPPESSFKAGVLNAISKGSVDIVFADSTASSETPIKKALCFYGTLISEDSEEPKDQCR
jgi:hypothetical protein